MQFRDYLEIAEQQKRLALVAQTRLFQASIGALFDKKTGESFNNVIAKLSK